MLAITATDCVWAAGAILSRSSQQPHTAREEVEMVVRSVAPLSAAKLAGVLYALIGFIIGGLFALAAMAGAFAADQDAGFMGSVMGIGAMVAFPLLYGCLGFVFTLLGAWLYNVVARMVGGIELDVV
jgi:hypothetical protein